MSSRNLPVVAVAGMAFEARIAAGEGVVTVYGSNADQLAASLASEIAKGCRGVVSFGIAGGLSPELKPGTCVVAREVVVGTERFAADREWSRRLLELIPGSVHADIAGASAPIASVASKSRMANLTGAAAVDMESFLSVSAAVASGLPFAAVRVVADPSHRALPPAALGAMRPDGTTDISAVLRSLAAQPSQISALIRIALDTRSARATLVRARQVLGPGFSLVDAAGAPSPAE